MIVYDDLTPGETITLGPTSASREDVTTFARAYDPQSFHLSDEAASRTYFKRLSASGWHTAAMTLALVTDNPDWPLACRGCREIRDLSWRAPVYPGDRLWAEVTLMARGAPEDESSGTATLAVKVANQDGDVVAGMTLVLAVARRAG